MAKGSKNSGALSDNDLKPTNITLEVENCPICKVSQPPHKYTLEIKWRKRKLRDWKATAWYYFSLLPHWGTNYSTKPTNDNVRTLVLQCPPSTDTSGNPNAGKESKPATGGEPNPDSGQKNVTNKEKTTAQFLARVEILKTPNGTSSNDVEIEDIYVKNHVGQVKEALIGASSEKKECRDVGTDLLYPSDEGLIDVGKALIKDSITTNVEFHKTMMQFSVTFVTLITTVFLLVTFGSSSTSTTLTVYQRDLIAIPIILMLLSCCCFVMGYYPRNRPINVGVIESIKDTRDELLEIRHSWAFWGVLLFCLSIILLFFVAVLAR
jgi:hypothetical protein